MNSPPAPRWLRLLNELFLVLIVLLLGLCGTALGSYLLHPEEYHFGTEVGGILYRSGRHYSGILLSELLVLTCGLVLSLLTRAPAHRMWIRLSVVFLDGLLFVGLLLSGGG